MHLLYMLPYTVLTGVFGFGGSLIALFILLQGLLRFLFFIILILARDWTRLKSEYKEGYSTVKEKVHSLYLKLLVWLKKIGF